MAMNYLLFLAHAHLYATSILLLSRHLILPASAVDQRPPAPPPQVLLLDEKTRLGSTPPSCHSRCDECNPCTAVQVPTVPAHNRGEPGLGRAFRFGFSSPLISNKYPNYKPLGWKCRCGDRLFNP